MERDLIKLTGLWGKRDRQGNEMLSGKLSYGVMVYIFKNSFKEEETDPDFIMYLGKCNGKHGNEKTDADE